MVAASAAGVFVLRERRGEAQGRLSAAELSLIGSIAGDEVELDENEEETTVSAEGDAGTGAAANSGDAGRRQFRHPRLGFTLKLPDGFSVGKFEEEESGAVGETTLVRGPDDAQLQIYVTPFDEEGPIIQERIRKDLPRLVILQAQQVALHGGMQALAFLSENEVLGKTQEVWFAHSGFLYQLTTTAPMSKDVARIIGSMKF